MYTSIPHSTHHTVDTYLKNQKLRKISSVWQIRLQSILPPPQIAMYLLNRKVQCHLLSFPEMEVHFEKHENFVLKVSDESCSHGRGVGSLFIDSSSGRFSIKSKWLPGERVPVATPRPVLVRFRIIHVLCMFTCYTWT